MNTKKHMIRAIVCLILFTLAADVVAPYAIRSGSTPAYSPDPPMPSQNCNVDFDYVFDCPTLSSMAVGSVLYTLKDIEVSYKISGGSAQPIASVNPSSCTISCPQNTESPMTCHVEFTIPVPAGSDCKSMIFQLAGNVETVSDTYTAYSSKAIIIGSSTGPCSNSVEEDEEPSGTDSGPISAGSVFNPDQTFLCDNINDPAPPGFPGCNYDFSCGPKVTDDTPIVRCKDCTDCKLECAKACGMNTRCLAALAPTAGPAKTCEQCCTEAAGTCGGKGYQKYDFWTCLSTDKPDEREACACQNACTGNCDANTALCNAINIMRILALVAAAILLAIHGLRLIMSQDPSERKNAKESIWFVILGTLIILIASALVGYLYVGRLIC